MVLSRIGDAHDLDIYPYHMKASTSICIYIYIQELVVRTRQLDFVAQLVRALHLDRRS